MDNKTIIKKVIEWQKNSVLHPLTCICGDHKILYPIEQDGAVILKCKECDYIQKHIPGIVLGIDHDMSHLK